MHPLFDPPGVVTISPGSSIATKPRTRVAPFGDGYKQRSGDGLNAIDKKMSLSFTALVKHEADYLEAFFTERAGYKPFRFTPPHHVQERIWIATEWNVTYTGAISYDVTASLEEVFDP